MIVSGIVENTMLKLFFKQYSNHKKWAVYIATIGIIITLWANLSLAAANFQDQTAPSNWLEFNLLDSTTGWVWLENRLYWTEDNGNSWQDITPNGNEDLQIAAVFFPQPGLGYVLMNNPEPEDQQKLWLVQTTNPKIGWNYQEIFLPDNGQWNPPIESYRLDFLDEHHGWLMVKYAGSSNFNLGALYLTRDGGASWVKSDLMEAGELYFSNPDIGWWVSGLNDSEIYQTTDSGLTWQPSHNIPLSIDSQGMTNFTIANGSTNQAKLLLAKGDPIELKSQTNLEFDSAEDFGKGIVRLDFLDEELGWGSFQNGQCNVTKEGNIQCQRRFGLLKTENNGKDWEVINLPNSTSLGGISEESFSIPSGTQRLNEATTPSTESLATQFEGHAFDKCEVPTLAQLQSWITSSPYRGLNLYIGGSLRSCANSALNADFVSQIRQTQGWYIIPTWVGSQAPCTNFKTRFSSNTTTAFQQGVIEANSALAVAQALNLSFPDQSGTIIYYDLEAYDTTNGSCNEAVKSFMNGWTTQIHAKRSLAGVYSVGPALNLISTIVNPPDAIWPAHWIYKQYNPAATVWDVYHLSNAFWSNHQRIRQYSGGHSESWGTVSLNIDSDVTDGMVLNSWRVFLDLPNQFFLPIIIR